MKTETWIILGLLAYILFGQKTEPMATRRLGYPRTDAERLERHKMIYGTDQLPPRGTGLRRNLS